MAHCGTKRIKKGHGGMAKEGYKKGGQPKYKHGECPKGKAC